MLNFTVLVYFPSHRFTVSLFAFNHNGLVAPSLLLVVIFWLFFLFYSFPMSVTTCPDCFLHPNLFSELSYCRHILPQKPSSGLFICSSNDTVYGYWFYIGSTPLYSLFPVGGTSPLPPLLSPGRTLVKNRPGSMIRRRRDDSAWRLKVLRYIELTVATKPLIEIDLTSAPHLYPLFFMLVALHLYPLFFTLADHPSKIVQDQWNGGAALISLEGLKSCGILCWQ